MAKIKEISWREKFEYIGFGNQSKIVGTKRVELLIFIKEEIKRAYMKGCYDQLNKKVDLGESGY
jgi:hypothetical protein